MRGKGAKHDADGQVLFREQRQLSDFFHLYWQPKAEGDGPLPGCDAVILEFLPPKAGPYVLAFALCGIEDRGSAVIDFSLCPREGGAAPER